MPIQTGVDPLKRLLLCSARGTVCVRDFALLARDVIRDRRIDHAKLVDLREAIPAVNARELEALARVMREARPMVERGPLAVVVTEDQLECALLFAKLEVFGRPAKAFTSIREARAWLDAQSRTNWVPAHRTGSRWR